MLTETEHKDEPILPAKRKLDLLPTSEHNVEENQSNKFQKNQSLTHEDVVSPKEEKTTPSSTSPTSKFSTAEGRCVKKPEAEVNVAGVEDEEENDFDFEDEEKENVKPASADRKGKGIMIEEEDEDSDDDDDSDSDSSNSSDAMDGDSDDLEDDPLAEVDLDNILPSRTRRKVAQPGVYIANDHGNNEHDDSSDSDA